MHSTAKARDRSRPILARAAPWWALLGLVAGCGGGGSTYTPISCVNGPCPSNLECVNGTCVLPASADTAGGSDTSSATTTAACLAQACATEIAACTGPCAAWWSCQQQCTASDPNCPGVCFAKVAGDATATQQSTALVQCYAASAPSCAAAAADVVQPDPDVTGADGSAGDAVLPGGCKTKADCNGGTCLLEAGKCVACTTHKQCAATEVCLGNACVAPTPCQSDKQCAALGALCGYSPAMEGQHCTDCLSYKGNGCSAGSECKDNICVPKPPFCSTSKDCAAYGLVCDGDTYRCVDCVTDADCNPGFQCSSLTCMPKPPVCKANKTACDGQYTMFQCASDGLSYQTITCPIGQECSGEAGSASCGPPCCQKNGATCGKIAACPYSCGTCDGDDSCVNNKCQAPTPKLGLGGACNESPLCPFPGSSASQATINKYFFCLADLCKSSICVNDAYCSSECTLAADADGDGIEDAGVPSTCTGAVNGPAGKAFRCVKQSYSSDYPDICVAGTTLKQCSVDADCPSSEACSLVPVLSSTEKRCVTKLKMPDGKSGVVAASYCDHNNQLGKGAVFCANGKCLSGLGCLAFCNNDADCAGAAANSLCVSGHCGQITAGSSCSTDYAQCSGPWTCKLAALTPGFTSKVCLQ